MHMCVCESVLTCVDQTLCNMEIFLSMKENRSEYFTVVASMCVHA